MVHLDLKEPTDAVTVNTTMIVQRHFIETLVLMLEPETQTWRMSNEFLLSALHGAVIGASD